MARHMHPCLYFHRSRTMPLLLNYNTYQLPIDIMIRIQCLGLLVFTIIIKVYHNACRHQVCHHIITYSLGIECAVDMPSFHEMAIYEGTRRFCDGRPWEKLPLTSIALPNILYQWPFIFFTQRSPTINLNSI